MCGRFALHAPPDQVQKRFRVGQLPPRGLQARYNQAPGQFLPVITNDLPETLQLFRWGLVPPWANDDAVGFRMINARAETVREKPAFREPFRLRRCLVPATGFYEWQTASPHKLPHFFYLTTGEPFAMAGLWERFPTPEGGVLHTFTVITTEPNERVAPFHDRMAAILRPEDERRWLRADPDEAAELLRPLPADALACHLVSFAVNSPRNEGPQLIDRATPPPQQGSLF